MTIEIVDLPIENGGSFHRFLYVYQRVFDYQSSKMFQPVIVWSETALPEQQNSLPRMC
jgi:hypothetical protein